MPPRERPPSSSLDFASVEARLAGGKETPADVIEDVLARIGRADGDRVWISVATREELLVAARAVEQRRARGEALPLYGLPFGVKDNIDVAGLPTTAGCRAFAYRPATSAPVVARLVEAGAIPIGKTNMDQFATGLVGTRSPYGVPRNPFGAGLIPGGSSSGSAVAVAGGSVSFALGTDTAGSGRVPAAFNNIVGVKPSRGLLSTRGVVPACRSRDCVSVFGLTVDDATRVADRARGYDAEDPYARPEADALSLRPLAPRARFRFGVPAPAQLTWGLATPEEASASRALFEEAALRLRALGGEAVPIDFAPLEEAAALLYGSAFVAERLEAAGDLLAREPEALLPVLRTILETARSYDARAAFEARAALTAVRRRARVVLDAIDCLLVPTAPAIYTVDAVAADPLGRNASLGRYVNFVNMLDLAAIAVPAGFRPDGVPFGVSLVGSWGADGFLAGLGDRLHRATSERLGATPHGLPAVSLERDPQRVPHPPRWAAAAKPPSPDALVAAAVPILPDWPRLAVVGAHLSGEPLNHQLTDGGGVLVRACRTAAAYKLFALPNIMPPKPGMVRVGVGETGVAIEVEVWALPLAAFGAFVARVPAPLVIGSVELDDGARVSGFLCEGHALAGGKEISSFGGWRAFRRSLA